jgi:hypothetical protein
MTEPVDYAKFDFGRDINFAVSEAIHAAPANADRAAEVLLLSAKLLRSGKPLPAELVDYLAGAFEASMEKPENVRVNALAMELNLKVPNRSPNPFDWLAAHKLIQANIGKSNAELKVLIMKASGCGETYASAVLKHAIKAQAEYDALMKIENSADQIPQ